jgi:hypothetical protein
MAIRGLKSLAGRVFYWAKYGITALFLMAVPILAIDYVFYRKLQFVPLNIVLYNVLNAGDGRGPDIYGLETGNSNAQALSPWISTSRISF